ncbi:MAG: hypothetical protein LLG24_01995 [Actinomycetia bacterium]|nr:hypothetical protein [Actinomycetes bacterium]
MSIQTNTSVIIWAALGVVVLIGLAVLGLYLWRRAVRRYLLGLIGRREGIRAGLRSLENIIRQLSALSDGELVALALDPDTEERRELAEVASQMHIAAEDLATMALPKRLVTAADALSDAAELLWEQAQAVATGEGVEVLDAIAAIDLVAVRGFLSLADGEIVGLMEQYHVEEPAVYGGGLYI